MTMKVILNGVPFEPLPFNDSPSTAALVANLHYYTALKEKAFHVHKKAIIDYEKALSALNNHLTQKYFNQTPCQNLEP